MSDRTQRENRALEIFSLPRYTRAEMLALTKPRVDSAKLQSWLRRGYLDLEKKYFVSGSGDAFDKVRDWARDEAHNAHRRYTGSNVINCMVLDAVSQSGLPFSLADRLTERALEVAHRKFMGDQRHGVAVVTMDESGHHHVAIVLAERVEIGATDWFTVMDLDRIADRFIEAIGP